MQDFGRQPYIFVFAHSLQPSFCRFFSQVCEAEERARLLVAAVSAAESVAAPTAPAGGEAHGSVKNCGT